MKLRLVLLTVLMTAFAASAFAGPISIDTWYEFAFSDAGALATGCSPDDPAGPFCIPSGGTPTSFADAPPWTFTTGASGATLTVTDAFESGDLFQIFDFGASAGLTSAFVPRADCGDDPVPCLGDPGMSHGVFAFGVGSHSITIVPTASLGGGAGYFRLEGTAGPSPVPEPATVSLVAAGLVVVVRRVRSNRS
jgi:hypothetical protein